MKKFLALMFAVMLVATLAACGPADDDNGDDNGNGVADPDPDKMVYMVTDMGGVDDASFNESAWNGLVEFGDMTDGWDVDYIESNVEEDYIPNLTAAVDAGGELVWAIGFMMADHLDSVAQDNPDKFFAIIDWAQDELRDNVAYVVFNEHEGSFLVGLIAGLTTESNVIGFIGGMEGDLIIKFESGFLAGVHAVNPDAEVIVQYAQSWSDTTMGEQLATQMIGEGADVIYHAAGGVGIGVAEACVTNDIWFIGVDMDQSPLAPENTLTSMLKRVDVAVRDTSKAFVDGTFPGGQVQVMGLHNDGVGYVQSEFIDADTIDIVEDWKQQILDGVFEVPFTRAQVDEFKADN